MNEDYITIDTALSLTESVLHLSKAERNAVRRYLQMVPHMRIVRCKECLFWSNRDCLKLHGVETPDLFFCGYGKPRKDGDRDG